MVLPILISVSPAPGPYWPAVQANPLTNTRLTADRPMAIIHLMTSSLTLRRCSALATFRSPLRIQIAECPLYLQKQTSPSPQLAIFEKHDAFHGPPPVRDVR